jgi:hypothetical protein
MTALYEQTEFKLPSPGHVGHVCVHQLRGFGARAPECRSQSGAINEAPGRRERSHHCAWVLSRRRFCLVKIFGKIMSVALGVTSEVASLETPSRETQLLYSSY